MVKRTKRTSVDRSKASDYRTVAENFFEGAGVAREYEYWNAAGVLIVHAAIALADAICIRLGGVKSSGGDHHEILSILEELVAPGERKQSALNQLRKIIDHKTAVSYSGETYDRHDIDRLWTLIDRFRSWALPVLHR